MSKTTTELFKELGIARTHPVAWKRLRDEYLESLRVRAIDIRTQVESRKAAEMRKPMSDEYTNPNLRQAHRVFWDTLDLLRHRPDDRDHAAITAGFYAVQAANGTSHFGPIE